ncbi:non-ribosomal peptide synthase/polyketide synthase, partial [Nocardia sp. NPDC052112]|uniref:non-ribosomal peptide synthase/polyketide synthase n=1 Tax=Nocardia sp. NPDC052112 TaxID=3155646 RepID=UPI00341D17D2
YLGRTDFQVKLRGLRIELGEIETALTAHDSVAQAVALVRSDARTGDQLVGYVVPANGATVDIDVLRTHLSAQLPSYMVPAALMVLDAMPLNPNGKLDRRALPEPTFEAKEFRAPSTPIEEIVADVFAQVLGLSTADGARPIGLDDDFFDLGGNSLIATQVVARLGAALDTRVPVRMLFEAPNVAALAARMEGQQGSGGRRELTAGPRPEQIPLSLAQQRMWFLNRFDNQTAVNNIPLAVRLTGALDTDALRMAVADVMDRHEVLRTVYPETADGHGVQVVLPTGQVHLDLTPLVVSEADIRDRISELVLTGFDVTADVPVRAKLFRLEASMDGSLPDTHVLVLVVHHISGDGWSVRPLARDVMVAYSARTRGESPAWAPLPVQYADFALWQRDTLGSEDDPESLIAQQVAYWSRNLAGLPDQLDLPSDRSRPAVASNRGDVYEFGIDAQLLAELNALARANGASLFMVVHAAFAALLARLSGSDDIAMGTAIAGRGEAVLDDAIGMFVNTLVLRTQVDAGASFTDLVARARETDLAAFGHADLPFERLVDILNPARSQARHPLFQVMLSFQNTGEASFELPGLEVAGVPLDVVTAKFDLHLNLADRLDAAGHTDGMTAEFAYATDMFDAKTIAGVAQRLVRLLHAVVADPAVAVGDVDLLDAGERNKVLEKWNETSYVVDAQATLVSMFEEQAARSPQATALTFEGTSLSYGEFTARVNRLARHLVSLGVGPDSMVALGMRRSFELVIGMYAVSVAGGAYVPLDPDHPAERTRYVLDTAQPVCVLTTAADEFDAGTTTALDIAALDLSAYSGEPLIDAERLAPLRPSNTAYVIFTSGSTGRPKGVAVSHAAIVNRLVWMQAEYGLDRGDVVLQKTPATFDVSVWEFWWPLQVGARLVIAKPDGHRDPAYLVRIIADEQVTTVHFVPSMLSVFVADDRAGECFDLRNVFASGEALPAVTAQRLRELTGVWLHNLYGPTEAAVDVTYHEVTDADTVSVPIGAPVFNTQVYVLDSRLHPVPVGVAGELYLAGEQLARGYVARPDLTADRFVANPFGTGARMYRTGDLVTWTGAGELEYLGRTDFQVKLRGLRIELGEIESALTALEPIAQAAVLVRSDERLGDQLVGYVIAAADRTVDIDQVRAELAGELPAYMVPTAFVVLDAFPLNASGKLDRKALPAPVFEAKVFRAPSTPIEEIVAGVFSDVLGVARVGLDDDFFELGGNSLLATQVTARIGAALDTQLAVRDLFEASTVAALSTKAEHNAGSGRSRPRLVAGERPARVPLSPAQQRYWFLNQFDTTTSAVDNIPLAVRLTGALDVAAVQQALGDVFARHEVLRTTYPSSASGPHQVILPADQAVPELTVIDVPESDLVRTVIEFALTTFDVTVQVPLKVALFRIAEQDYVLAFTVHHVAADGSSMGPLARDVMVAYVARAQGEIPQWQPLPVQYADYALWQRAVLGSEEDPESLAAQQVAYWQSALAGMPDQLELPADRPRPRAQSFQGKAIRFEIAPDKHARLHELARAKNASLFMVVHAALAVLLARLSGTDDIAVGTPIAGRGERELDDLIGMFVNTLVFRTVIEPGATFVDLLADVRERDLEAFANADVPFERLVEVLNPERSTARNPLFQVGLSFQNLAETTFTLPGLSVSAVNFDSQLAKTDLHVTLYDRYAEDGTPAQILTEFGYATDLFDEATVQGFADRFELVLDAILADPDVRVGEIDLLSPDENTRILHAWNDTAHELDIDASTTLVSLLDATVAASPDAVALVAEDTTLTYAELDADANRLARHLIALGVGAEDRVALAIRRSVDLVVAMYAVAKSGAAYVPIDPDQPAERTDYILGTAAPVCVLTTGRDAFGSAVTEVLSIDELDLSGVADGPITDGERLRPLAGANTAYVIFTSGSTGQPKGVAVPHAAIVNQLLWKTAEFGLGADDAVLLKTAATFDLSVWEFWSAAVCGGRLVIADADGHRDPAYLNDLMRSTGVTTLHVVPSMLDALLTESGRRLPESLRRVLAIGEALPATTAQRFRRDNAAELFNLYGPTEAAVSITAHTVTDADTVSVPIGGPEWNSQVYVLDSRLRPVPVGVSGELYLAGAQLARGYFGRVDLTSDRFVADPFGAGTRMYRTGDLVAWNAAGELEYRGRTDFQVKIRGFRIELGEIEAALLRQPEVSATAVLAHTDPNLGDRLVAYVVLESGELDNAQLQSALAAELPSYMVPSVFLALDALPLNANGKLDRKALPAPTFEKAVFRAPVTPIEEIVANTFAEVLHLGSGAQARKLGLDDDFFAWGGNSLLATQVAARLGAALNVRVPVRLLFEAPTVGALAIRVEQQADGPERHALIAGPRPEHIPLSLAQQRMWFLNRFDTQSAAYNIPIAVRLTGALDVAALRAAIADLVRRHEVLRTIYPETESGPVQLILPVGQAIPELDIRTITLDQAESAVIELISAPFDVTVEVPVRGRLFQLEPADSAENAAPEYVIAMVVHHIAGDGSSMGPLTRDLMTAYAARAAGVAPNWAPLEVQYADYSIWQRELLGSEDDSESLMSKQLAYWRTALAELPEQLDLPADRPRPAVQSFAGGTVEVRIDAETHRGLGDLAQAEGATLFMVVHTALAVLLSRLSGTQDIAIGTPMAGRGEAALNDLIGTFINTLVFRTRLEPGEPFADLLRRQRETDIQAFANADVPFERLVEVLNPVRSQARHPLFQVGLSFQNLAQTTLELPELTVSGVDFDTRLSQFDLHLILTDLYDESGAPAGITGVFTYATDLFDRSTVEGFTDRFSRLLGEIIATPRTTVGDLELLTAVERERMLAGWNATTHPVAPELLLDGYRRAAAAHPDAVAVVYEGAESAHPSPDHHPSTTLTYREFDERVNKLARLLISQGVGAESLVGLAVRRSLDLVVGMYAIVAAGGAYVPLDPDHPAERIAHILATAQPACVVTTAADAVPVPADIPVLELDSLELDGFSSAPIEPAELLRPVTRDNPAYVIFTSGSTGRPKGVAVSHGAINNQIEWMLAQYPLGSDDVYLQKTATTFDVSLWGYFMPLRAGAKLVVATHDGHRDPAYVADAIAAHGVTVTDFVPSMLTVFATQLAAGSCPTLRDVFVIGEALPPETVTAWRAVSDAVLHNLYGPTEAAVSVTYWPAGDTDVRTVPIGLPQWNTQVYVLDSRLRPVPAGVAGELYLAGDQLARGYVARPDLTSDRFVANPFAQGQRMYRTGDLVVWREPADAGQRLEYLGRTDFQVKFRGQRIELGEIETALLAHAAVSQAAALVAASALGDQLVAYVVPAPEQSVDQRELLAAVSDVLPAYMVPAAIVVLDAFPLNSSGKLDRKALPEPTFTSREFRAPATPVEEIVAGVFGDVLGTERVGADDDFFALGGNSLVATQVVGRLSAAIGGRVPVRALFEAPTVAALAVKLEQLSGVGERRALVAAPRPDPVPLSLAQQRMWFLNRFDTESAAYNLPIAVRLTGALDVDALRAAMADLIGRHEILRTVYPETAGAPAQVILPVAQVVPALELRPIATAELESTVIAVMAAPFDVTAEVPVRLELFQVTDAPTDAAEFVLVLVVHHIAGDGSSMGPLTRDLMTAYAARSVGESPTWAPLPVQYADYAIWQRELLGSEDDPESLAAKQIAYWQSALADVPDQLDLPSDRPRPAVQSFAGGKVELSIDAETHRALVALARSEGATLFMVVHTAFAVLLSRLSGTDDIAIGTPMAGRGEAVLDDLIGMFVNTLVFRTQLDRNESFTELLGRQRETDIQAFAHADVPFERLVEVLNPVRSQARHPLFQVGLSFQNLGRTTLELPGLTVAGFDIDTQLSQFDLHLIVADSYAEDGTASGIGGYFTYANDLFDADTVRGFADRFARVLAEIIAAPRAAVGDLEIMAADERRELVSGWNATAHQVDSSATLASLLDRTVAATPDAVALVGDDGTAVAHPSPDHHPSSNRYAMLTYGELGSRVNQLARHLISLGVGPEVRVALALRRSVDLVVAMYAVTQAGGAYVPLDPDQAGERTDYILETARPLCVVTNADTDFQTSVTDIVRMDALADVADAPIADAERIAPLRAANTAYVIFTSGSTGRPKGVAVPHAAIVNQLLWKTAEFGLGADDAVLLKTAATFDLSVWEFWSAAVCGGRLVIADADGHRDPTYLNTLMRDTAVTTLHVVPSMLDALLIESDGQLPESLRRVLAIGEALPAATAQRFRESNTATLFNLYGPTEAAVSITNHEVTDADTVSVSIGAPEWNSRVYVLDSRLRPVPVGVSGELYLAGAQLARGYFGRVELTAERFVADPFESGARMYRTGDLVAWNAAGELEYRGRTDFQVKIRGFRIELGEIEAALLRQPSIASAAVLAHTDPALGDRLVAYVVPAITGEFDKDALQSALAAELPSYMVPSVFLELEALPLNANGKLDRKALPQPTFEHAAFRAPVTPVEQIVAGVFADVLGIERIGADDDFFALGGNSILSIQLVSRAKTLGVVFSVRDVFDRRSVAGLAAIATSTADLQPTMAELPGGGIGEIPLPPSVTAVLANGTAYQRFSYEAAVALPSELDGDRLRAAIAALVDRHDALRTRLRPVGEGWEFEALERGAIDVDALVHEVGLDTTLDEDYGYDELMRLADNERAAAADRLDPANGVMAQFVRCSADRLDGGNFMLVVVHGFAADPKSLGVLTGDLLDLLADDQVALPEVGTSLRRWAYGLTEQAGDRATELPFWHEVSATPDPLLGARAFDPALDTVATTRRVRIEVPTDISEVLLTTVPTRFHGGVPDGLLSALAMALLRWRGAQHGSDVLIRLDGDGRVAVPGAELSRTVGAFTAAYPARLSLGGIDLADAFDGGAAAGSVIKSVKEQLLAVPDQGVGHGLLLRGMAVGGADGVGEQLPPAGQVGFRYQEAAIKTERAAAMPANGALDIAVTVGDEDDGPRLLATFEFPVGLLSPERVQELAELWVAALAALAKHAQRPDAGGHTPSDLPLVQVGQADIELWEQTYPGLDDVWPVSPLQSGLLFHALMTSATLDVYTIQAVVQLAGTVDVARLNAAAQAILDRYPNLRTAFVTDSTGQVRQVVLDRVEVPWRVVDLTELPEAERAEELRRRIEADHAERFDMTAPPLVRYTLLRTAAEEWSLAITTHHVLLDGWSMPLLMRDLLVLYATRGDQSVLPEVSSYRDFLDWLATRDQDASLRVWAEAFDGATEPTELAAPARTAETFETAKLITRIDADRTRQLTKHCAELGITVNTLVQAAWGILVGRLTGRADVVFGATVSGRPAELTGVESMVGLFINTLPVRVRIDDRATIGDQLERLQREQAELLDHHYVGLSDIQRAAGIASHFDTLLVFESYPIDREAIAAASSIDGMSVTDVGVDSATHYPLTLQVTAESTLEFTLEYLISRFTADEVETLSTRLIRVLDALVGDAAGLVGDIDILDADERARLLVESGIATTAPAPEPVGRVGARTVSRVLAEVVEADPEAPALLVEGDEIAYHELDRRSSQLARVLIAHGAGPGDVVALALPRSVDAVVAVWAIQKAGAACLFAGDLSAAEMATAGAIFGITLEPVDGPINWLVPSDPAVQAELATAPSHPVSYADRVRPLAEEHPAFVVLAADGTVRAFSQTEALEQAEQVRSEYDIDYESTTLTTAVSGRVAFLESLSAATAGALSVLPSTDDIADDLADGEVTHWFVTVNEPTDAADEDIRIVVVE